MKKNIAVYAGTFDPITNGHLDIIDRASEMYDTLHITIFTNVNKQCLFTIEQRLEFIKESTKHLDNVVISMFDGLAVEYARNVGAGVLVRGLRAVIDFEYELQLAYSNQYLDKSIEMVFLMTKPQHSFISSSSVKEIAKYNKDVSGLVPSCVNLGFLNHK